MEQSYASKKQIELTKKVFDGNTWVYRVPRTDFHYVAERTGPDTWKTSIVNMTTGAIRIVNKQASDADVSHISTALFMKSQGFWKESINTISKVRKFILTLNKNYDKPQ